MLESEGQIGVGMESEDWRIVLSWHGRDVLKELGVLDGIWNVVVELSDLWVEAVSWLEHIFSNPKATVGDEHLSVEIVSNFSTILYITHHEAHCLP